MQRLTIFLIFIAYNLVAQNSNIRQGHSLTLLVDETAAYKIEVPTSSIIIENGEIQVYPGERLLIEADLINSQLKNLKVVQTVKIKEKTLVIELSQISNGQVHKQMKLSIFNPFNKELNYSANIYLMKHNTWTKTTVIPVGAGKTSFEFWPDIISTITLGDLTFTK